MFHHAVLPAVLIFLGWSSTVRAEQVLVTAVEGQVLFGPNNLPPMRFVKAGERFGAGTFAAAHDAVLHLSTFGGSELRLSEAGTLHYDGTDEICHVQQSPGPRSTFHLLQGKVQVNIKVPAQPPHCYHIILPQGQASISHGQCVMCMHGGGAFLYVADGDVTVSDNSLHDTPLDPESTPIYGALPTGPAPAAGDTIRPIFADHTQVLVGNGQVGVLGINGNLGVQPLSSMSAATQTCLLSGFNPNVDMSAGRPWKSSSTTPPPDAATAPGPTVLPGETNSPPVVPRVLRRLDVVVSPTQ